MADARGKVTALMQGLERKNTVAKYASVVVAAMLTLGRKLDQL